MTRLLAPNLPRPFEGCDICTNWKQGQGTFQSRIDAYVQHHKDVHGWTTEIGWQQTYAWANRELDPEQKRRLFLGEDE